MSVCLFAEDTVIIVAISNGRHCVKRRTSASYHHVHLADDLAQFDHSEAVHAVREHADVFPFVRAAQTVRTNEKQTDSAR